MIDLEEIKAAVARAISPLKPAGRGTPAAKDFLFTANRTDAGRSLPPYYLVYFLLVDLLGFQNIGQFEKVAWSVPVDFKGKAFLIEHRKFGWESRRDLLPDDEAEAEEVARLIERSARRRRLTSLGAPRRLRRPRSLTC